MEEGLGTDPEVCSLELIWGFKASISNCLDPLGCHIITEVGIGGLLIDGTEWWLW